MPPHSLPPTRPPPVQSTSAKQRSVPDLVLEGHAANAEFAVALSNAAPLVASGGKDTKVRPCCAVHPGSGRCIHVRAAAACTAHPCCMHALPPLHGAAGDEHQFCYTL